MKQSEVKTLFRKFEGKKVVIIGDVMLDAYLWGNVERISPESPVPVVDVDREEYRLGGAGNVALNVTAMGAQASLFAVTGDDGNAYQLRELMEASGLATNGILATGNRATTTKTRILGRNQQMLRIDRENRQYLKGKDEKQFLGLLEDHLMNKGADVVIIQDYNKGVLTKKVIDRTISICRAHSIPVTVDPKEQHFFGFQQVDLFKPNLKELNDNLHLHLGPHDLEGLQSALARLHRKMPHGQTLVTLSANGMAWFDGKTLHHIKGHQRSVADVSGAGDTVIGIAALGWAAGLDRPLAIQLANLAGGLVCEEVGVVPIDRDKLMAEVAEVL